MKHSRIGTFLAGVLCCLLAVAGGPAGAQEPAASFDFDIARQPLGEALKQFTAITGIQHFFSDATATNVTSQAVQGRFTARAALDGLLRDSGFSASFTDDHTIVLQRSAATPAAAPPQSKPPVGTKGTLSGRVIEALSGQVLSGALVSVVETGQSTATDDLGSFRIPNLPAGDYTVAVSYLGYEDRTWLASVAEASGSRTYGLEKSAWNIDQVLVLGTRSARAKALNLQRSADNTSSVISSDVLGNFPDATIAEALRRAPGISFQRGSLGEGTNVVIRGVQPQLNNIQLNGLNLPSTDPGRQRIPNIANMLTDSIEKITINESVLPSHDSAGIGGLIEIVTKSPLSRPHRYSSVSFERGRKGSGFGEDYSAAGTLSGTFGAERNFGVSLSAQFQHQEGRTYTYLNNPLMVGEYLPLDPFGQPTLSSRAFFDPRLTFPLEPGVDGAYISGLNGSVSDTELTNRTVTLSGEWQPSAGISLQLDLQRSVQERTEFRRESDFGFDLEYQPLPVAALDGEVRQALVWTGFGSASQSYSLDEDQNTTTDTLSLRGSVDHGAWEHGWLLGFAQGRLRSPNVVSVGFAEGFGFPVPIDPAFVSDAALDSAEGRVISAFGSGTGRHFPVPLLSDAGWDYYNDPANYSMQQVSLQSSEGRNRHGSAEWRSRWKLDRPHVKYLEVGADFEQTDFDSANSDRAYVAVFGPMPSAADLGIAFGDANLRSIGITQRGFESATRAGISGFVARLDQLASGAEPVLELAPDTRDPRLNDESLDEKNLATYLQARIDFGKLSFVGGARATRVDVKSVTLTGPRVTLESGLEDEEFFRAFSRLDTYQDAGTDLLPRFQLNYRQTENLIFRASYALSVARPSPTQLSSQTDLLLNLSPFVGNLEGRPELVVRRGNPGLKPAIGNNYDLAAEFYSAQIGAIKIGGFYKVVSDLLDFESRAGGVALLEGVQLPDDPHFAALPENILVIRERPVNSSDDTDHWGVSIAVERQFPSWPGLLGGLGVYGNFTYSREEFAVPDFLWFSKPVFDESGNFIAVEEESFDAGPYIQEVRSGTAAITYSRGSLDGSLAYSWQGTELEGFAEYGLRDDRGKMGSLDFRLQYQLGTSFGRYGIYFEGQDLLRGPRDLDDEESFASSSSASYTRGASYFGGRTLRVGVNASF